MGIVVTAVELEGIVAAAHESGRLVSLANGHFDLLHVGHLRYLQGSKAEADLLIVAVNNDDSVERLKGPGRPVIPATERAELLALCPVRTL